VSVFVAVVVLVAILILAAWLWVDIVLSACQWFLFRLGQSRDTVKPASPPQGDAEGPFDPGPDPRVFGRKDPHSSPYLPAVGFLGAIDPSPNFSAFGAGLELIVFATLFTIGGLLVLNWIIKTMKGSD
jgi:hypothetical protein